MPEGAPEAFGSNGLAAYYTGPVSGQPSKARVVGLVSSHGQGALVMAAVVVDRYTDAYTALAEDLARSVAFFPTQTAAAGPRMEGRPGWIEIVKTESPTATIVDET